MCRIRLYTARKREIHAPPRSSSSQQPSHAHIFGSHTFPSRCTATPSQPAFLPTTPPSPAARTEIQITHNPGLRHRSDQLSAIHSQPHSLNSSPRRRPLVFLFTCGSFWPVCGAPVPFSQAYLDLKFPSTIPARTFMLKLGFASGYVCKDCLFVHLLGLEISPDMVALARVLLGENDLIRGETTAFHLENHTPPTKSKE